MKKLLHKDGAVFWWCDEAGLRITDGSLPPELSGNVSGLRGNVSWLRGNVSGLSGNTDDCELTEEDRESGLDISDLVESEVLHG